jgi:integrase
MTSIRKLTAGFVSSVAIPGRYGDGNGLYLQVTQWGDAISKQWLFRFQIDGRSRQMGLGSASIFSLADARARARGPRQMVADKIDPIEARDQERQQRRAHAVQRLTFEQAAEKFIAGHEKKWTNPRHVQNWRSSLALYAYPRIGKLSVELITAAHVIELLEAIWTDKTETAARLRGRIEAILDWAKVRHLRSGENPARWRGHLDKVFASRRQLVKVEHHAAVPYADVPAVMAALRKVEGPAARALELTMLCATRTDETLEARWPEFDLDAKVWTIPAERMKAGRAHSVPLSDAALALVQALPRIAGEDLLFPGRREGRSLRKGVMLEVLHALPGCATMTVHGMRSSFRDWCGNETSFPRELAEMALAHHVGSAVERSYRRGDALAKRAKLMQAWASYCGGAAASTVTPLKDRAALA